jgi:hypothetical protein
VLEEENGSDAGLLDRRVERIEVAQMGQHADQFPVFTVRQTDEEGQPLRLSLFTLL